MGRNADAILIIWCPPDEGYGEPLLIVDAKFGIVDFVLSLRDGVWPHGLAIEYEGEEWIVVPGLDEKKRAIQVIVSESDVVKGPSSNGYYFVEYTWMMERRRPKPRGIDYGRKATVTEEQAVEIHDRYLYSPERPTQTELAEEYGVGQKQISNIVLERAWAYLWEGQE